MEISDTPQCSGDSLFLPFEQANRVGDVVCWHSKRKQKRVHEGQQVPLEEIARYRWVGY